MLFNDLHIKNKIAILITLFVMIWAGHLGAQADSDYHGYRLHVFNVEIQKEGKDFYQIRFNAANTGRRAIEIKTTQPLPYLSADYDNSLFERKLGAYRENIRRVLTVTPIDLKVGKIKNNISVRFPKMLPEDTIRNPKVEPTTNTPIDVVLSKDSLESYANNEPVFQEKGSQCFDFALDTVKVLSIDNKWLTLEYTLINKGALPAPMLGTTRNENDNLAIRAYISGAPRMSKGALVFGGTFVPNMEKGEDGKIPPGMRYAQTFRLDIRDKSRYMNYLILSLDPFQTVGECDERNNIYVVDLTAY